jgi:hypothetical protein
MQNDRGGAHLGGAKLPDVRSRAARRPSGSVRRFAYPSTLGLASALDHPLESRRPRLGQTYFKQVSHVKIRLPAVRTLIESNHR